MADGVLILVDGPFAGDRVVVDPDVVARDRGLTFAVRGDRRELLSTVVASLDSAADPKADARRIAREWRAVHYANAGVMKLHFDAHYLLRASAVDGHVTVRRGTSLDLRGMRVWPTWSASLDGPARRFAEVAALFPPGPMAEYVTDLTGDVADRLAEAGRLARVGEAAYPEWRPGDIDPRAESVAAAIDDLHDGLLGALDALVELHLAVLTSATPEIPRLEALLEAWRELLGP